MTIFLKAKYRNCHLKSGEKFKSVMDFFKLSLLFYGSSNKILKIFCSKLQPSNSDGLEMEIFWGRHIPIWTAIFHNFSCVILTSTELLFESLWVRRVRFCPFLCIFNFFSDLAYILKMKWKLQLKLRIAFSYFVFKKIAISIPFELEVRKFVRKKLQICGFLNTFSTMLSCSKNELIYS